MAPAMDEDALLAEMLVLAERLTTTDDALMAGQYAYLRARIAALVELRGGEADRAA
ncbi:hypothetical protein [Rhizorhabdus sp.]|jgi:hypothetical protein|uniref:hypothetical protein n=1 Tax=Rhizorhabdus sp. TaxID=1968843 RepID=UPI001B59F995|nr:hypothetical protein [Rhizorhabdus sp.]MBP8233221.1 hypothetical protein [Rhizorhabdus sp.]